MLSFIRAIFLILVISLGLGYSANEYTIAVLRFENNSLMNKEALDGQKRAV